MGNQSYYTYEGISLWEAGAWKDRYSPVTHLARWIEANNHALIRDTARLGIYDARSDGTFTAKTRSVTYPDVVAHWRDKGLVYICGEMAQVNWIALLPESVFAGGAESQKLLLVLHDADYSDPNWAMNTLEYYRSHNDIAARDGLVLLYVVTDGVDKNHTYANILRELGARFHVALEKVYLDISLLERTGTRLRDIEGFGHSDRGGEAAPDPDSSIERICGIPVLDISGRWQNKISLLYKSATAAHAEHPAFDLQRLVHSAAGKRIAEAMNLEHTYGDALDPGLLRYWEDIGVRYESHDKDGQQWVTLTPTCAYDQPGKTLPVMLVFQEVTYIDPFQAVTALSSYYEYADIVAQGELMLIFFALETPDDNDLMYGILQDAAKIYPIDLTRVYVTGHSHNGHFCMEFMRRHHGEIAAAASLGNAFGLPAPAYSHEALKVTDEMVDLMSTFDMPVIDICGYSESDFINNEVETQAFADVVDSWQRRLRAFNCPMKSFDEVAAAKSSPDYVTRMIGVPSDNTEVQYRMGGECYIADLLNREGKHRLRLVSLENFPHMCAPQMPGLTWDFVRRFARDLSTGEVIERY